MKLKNNYFIFGNQCDYCEYMVYDSLDKSNVFFNNDGNPIKNRFFLFLYKIHRRLKLPCLNKWYKLFFNFKQTRLNNACNVFIFYDSSPLTCDTRFLEYIKNKIPNSIRIIYFSNSLSLRFMNDPNYFKKYFDEIYTCDYKDAIDNNFIFLPDFYSLIFKSDKKPENDLFFIGAAKGREELLLKAYYLAKENGLKVDFNIIGSKILLPEEIKTNRLSYKEVVDRVVNSRAILDIVGEGASFTTLRYNEAIVYNKYLITNNETYQKLNYYKTGNIKIINLTRASKADFSIPNKKIDYNYKNDFSFYRFLQMLDNKINKSN